MALVFKKLLASDTINELIEKINFNNSQVKLNGGGSQGLPGKDSVVKGIPGIRGNIWHYGIDDPNFQVITDLQDNDLYLSDTGNVWECVDSINQTWINTNINIKGDQGDDGNDGSGIFSTSDNTWGLSSSFEERVDELLANGFTQLRINIVDWAVPEAIAIDKAAITIAVWLTIGYYILTSLGDFGNDYIENLSKTLSTRAIIGFFYYLIIILMYYLIAYNNNLQEKIINETKLIGLVKEAELNALKSQINPHFLFNSLNSIGGKFHQFTDYYNNSYCKSN